LVDLPIVRRAEALLALADRLVKDREGAAQAADTESEVD
jgi:hypothetical protein